MEPYQPAPRAELTIFRIRPSATEAGRSLTCRPQTSFWIADPFHQTSAHVPQQPCVVDGGDGDATTAGPRTGIPHREDDTVAMPPTPGNSHRSVDSARSTGEREPDPRRPKGRMRRRRSHRDAAAGHRTPRPIYSPAAQIRGSHILPPLQRTEKEKRTAGGAGETGGKLSSPSHSPLSTVARGGERGVSGRRMLSNPSLGWL